MRPGTKRLTGSELLRVYRLLFARFGPQHWWPAKTPFEVMVGAILTQNASWQNVERAIANLERQKALEPSAIGRLSQRQLQRLIKPSGFFRVKARRLRSFIEFLLQSCKSDIARMRRRPMPALRSELLSVHGIGRETADSILLYALNKPVFVIDAYTRRILSRHRLIDPKQDYEAIRKLFERNLPRSVKLYNEYHALLVRLAKTHCRTRALCKGCPLETYLGGER